MEAKKQETITIELVKHVAAVARLELSEEEAAAFVKELKEVLDVFSIIAEANTANIEPSYHPVKLPETTREDEASISISQEKALSNVRHKKDGYIIGPKIL